MVHLAAGEGFEPSHTESESAVLPLHNPAKRKKYYTGFFQFVKTAEEIIFALYESFLHPSRHRTCSAGEGSAENELRSDAQEGNPAPKHLRLLIIIQEVFTWHPIFPVF